MRQFKEATGDDVIALLELTKLENEMDLSEDVQGYKNWQEPNAPVSEPIKTNKDPLIDLYIERCVIGEVFRGCFRGANLNLAGISSEMFSDPFLESVFLEIKMFALKNEPFTMQALGRNIRKGMAEEFTEQQICSWINQVMDEIEISMKVRENTNCYKDYFLPKLQDLHSKRQIREKIINFLPEIENDTHTFSDFRKISETFQREVGMCGFLDLEKQDFTHEEAVQKFFEDYETREDLIPSGIDGLDAIIGGFSNSNLIMIAGRPAMGKSALAVQFAKTICDSGKNALFFSMEMTNRQLYARIMSNELINTDIRIPYMDFVQKKVNSNEYPAAKEYLLNTKSNIKIDYSSSQSLEMIRQKALKLDYELKRQDKKLDIIFIDHLAKMDFSGDTSKEVRNRFTNAIVGLKNLAKDMGIPVVVLSQLNRDNSRRADQKPLLTDLKETGAIEEEADVILFPFRPVYFDAEKYKKEYMEIIVAKNRDGQGGVVVRCNGDMRYNHIIDDHNDYIKGKEGWTLDAIMQEKEKPKNNSAIEKFRSYRNEQGMDF